VSFATYFVIVVFNYINFSCRVVEEKHKELLWEHEVLEQRFAQIEKERNELYENFVDRIIGVQQKSGFKNLVTINIPNS
jgi:growth arrest-specific protein 8